MHKLTARVYLMVFDHGLTLKEATEWVVRNMPVGLRGYYRSLITRTMVTEVLLSK